MLYVRYTDPPTHIVGTDEIIYPALIESGRSPVDEMTYAKMPLDERDQYPVKVYREKRITLTHEEVRQRRPIGVQDDLALINDRAPGDVICMTAVLRELHRNYPGRFRTVVQTRFPEIWQGNPYAASDAEIVQPRRIDWDWREGSKGETNRHFSQCWRDALAEKIGLPIPMASICGDLYLTEAEMRWPADLLGDGPRSFGLINAGVRPECRTKGWGIENYQAILYYFGDDLEFVQIGNTSEHLHRKLDFTTDLLGRTTLRDLMRLMYWADFCICPVTMLMHLSAAIPTQDGSIRPCFVLCGGRESPSISKYEGHEVFSTVGVLDCCKTDGCWRQCFSDDRSPDYLKCLHPVHKADGEQIGKCFDLIQPRRVIDAMEAHIEGKKWASRTNSTSHTPEQLKLMELANPIKFHSLPHEIISPG
jgi:ADP-heptose:LPS heptosyltransferase